ncbi:hypothetical protein E2K98_03950 [Bacillus salipaludis]|uniref:Uncharacterized protein n=1 Tax=Bacillus salipaludis TaxID=2547811 RepID=A0A4V3AUC2_9BACI|nr:hypothetical protein [Bacillus salipaludis]MDQ6595109.1 hypothetical protein [Bacillus salipaludis]MED1469004.1 hypothetical protein [Bacillus salipaludis]TDK64029.1 hypothetical protein E2K98_03950 [Bacillus salipaludis]
MGINVHAAHSQANKISHYASTLRDVQQHLVRARGNLNNGWQAEEMLYVNQAIEQMSRDMAALASKLEGISSDVRSAANDINREEEAKAEREAKAKAEAEAKAKKAHDKK